MRTLAIALAVLLASHVEGAVADDVQYRPGGRAFERVWDAFYKEDRHETQIPIPLVRAGAEMTVAISEAVSHKDMLQRRYAIAALGLIGDRRALPTLEAILNDESELDYFRGDALQSIFRIDQPLGRRYAKSDISGPEYLRRIAEAVERNEPWLTERMGRP